MSAQPYAFIRWLAASLALGGGPWCAQSAHGHSPPQLHGVTRMADGQRVLVTNRGLIFEPSGDGAWQLLCGAALGVQVDEQIEIAGFERGRLLTATSHGLLETVDGGCTWNAVPGLDHGFATSLAQSQARRERLFVAVAAAGASRIERSNDGGNHWQPVIEFSDFEVILRVIIAPSDDDCVYASGYTIDPSTETRQHFLVRSVDAGQTWEKSLIPVPPPGPPAQLFVEAVHPEDPDTLAIALVGDRDDVGQDLLLISRDGGQSFETQASIPGLADAALDYSGNLWFASDDGLQRVEPLAGVEQVGDSQLMSFVSAQDGSLLVGGHYAGFSPIDAGLATLGDTEIFSPIFRFVDTLESVQCSPDSPATKLCAALWYDWQLEVLVGLGQVPATSIGIPPDSTMPPKIASVGVAQESDRPSSGCAIHAPAPGHSHAGICSSLLLLFVFGRRSRACRAGCPRRPALRRRHLLDV